MTAGHFALLANLRQFENWKNYSNLARVFHRQLTTVNRPPPIYRGQLSFSLPHPLFFTR